MNIQFPHFLAKRLVSILSQIMPAIKSRPMIVSVTALLIALLPAVNVFAGHETGSVTRTPAVLIREAPSTTSLCATP